MKYFGTNTYFNINHLPARRFSSVSPNVEFIDLAKQLQRSTENMDRRRVMIRDQIAFHYVVNVYHVNSVSGIEDIKPYREIPHVLIGGGSTIRAFPYFGHEDACAITWENLVWGKLYGDGLKETKTPLNDSNPSNRTYIDILAEGVNFKEDTRRVRVIFKIIDGQMCELWWLNGSKEHDRIFTVIDNYKTFCEMTNPSVYTNDDYFNRPKNVNYDEWPFIRHFFNANLYHSSIVSDMNNIISKERILEYALHFQSFRVRAPYINQSLMDKEDVINKIRFAVSVTYMLFTCAKFVEGDLYFGGDMDKYRDNLFIKFEED